MPWNREEMAARAGVEVRDGDYVNLGIGIPTLVANCLPSGISVTLHSENGILGMGPFPIEGEVDPDLINAGKETVTLLRGASIFSSAESFAMVRGGHIDLAILGGMQVSEKGDLANWIIPGKRVKGMGGSMDIVTGAKRVVVLMKHVGPKGKPKLLRACNLPLTGQSVVKRVITDMAVLDITSRGFEVVELAPGTTADELRKNTDADLVWNLGKERSLS